MLGYAREKPMHEGLDAAIAMFSLFGGTSLIIWTSMKAKIARIKAEADAHRLTAAPSAGDAVLNELRALKQQMSEMQSTGHQFDLSFDEALNRMESRVARLETKSAVSGTMATDTPATLRNGQD